MNDIKIKYILPDNSNNTEISKIEKNKKISYYIKIENGGWYIKMECEYIKKNYIRDNRENMLIDIK